MASKEPKATIQMIADYHGDLRDLLNAHPNDGNKGIHMIPILATRNQVIFPGVVTTILIGRETSRNLASYLQKNPNEMFAIFCQKDSENDFPADGDLYQYGVYARLIRVLEIPGTDDAITLVLQALGRCSLQEILQTSPFLVGYTIDLEPEVWKMGKPKDEEFQLVVNELREATLDYAHASEDMVENANFVLENISEPTILVNYVCTHLPMPIDSKIDMIMESNYLDRAMLALKAVRTELQLLELKQRIKDRTKEDLDAQQREYFLMQQMKNIKEELGTGEGSPERQELLEQAEGKAWPEEVERVFQKELDKLEILHPQSPDYSVQLTYLQTLVALPWGTYTEDDLDLKRAQEILDKDHYGMEKVKERILEYLAVLKQRGDLKSPILCLYGPPGVGKTSLGKSIAQSMNRKYVRVSLGGLHDESEIRGHRRTYVGAMPGRIIKNIQKAGTSNPVFVLDEIDKVTQHTINGDPSSALLEVLDPEQNNAFHDNYLDVDYDLSKVMFIATANDLGTIPRPLLDRMEIIEVGGYITEEKIEIARHHLVPRELANTGFDTQSEQPKFPKATLEKIVEQYTRESGVRQLEKQINKAMRKLAYIKVRDKNLPYTQVKPKDLKDLLGKPPFYRDIYQGNDYAGVVTGLAWTSVGGEILFIETSLSRSKQAKLTLTGNLGDVMKESAVIALEYVKAHAQLLQIDYRIFDEWNIHIHVPEGATPKDGPSAGITIATSIASALTQRKVRKNLAMTGEITLRGKVLPVGGIKEKILAAKRAGITDIVMCTENRKDIEEIPAIYLENLTFHYVTSIAEVWQLALTDELVDNPVHFTFDNSTETKK